jgi:phage terminase large subunit
MQLDVTHPDLWNEVYLDFLENPKIYNVLWGGSGGGKSNFLHQRFLAKFLSSDNYRAYFFRKTRSSIRQSLWTEVKNLATEWGIEQHLTFYESRFEVNFGTNSIIMMGLDDEQKIKSLAPANEVWLEEVNEFSLEDFTQVTLRLRGQSDEPKRFWLTFNPVNETHWLKGRFFDHPPGNEVDQIKTLKTTYLDNKFLDPEYIARLNSLAEVDPYYHAVYTLGEWGQVDPESLFAPKFNKAAMVSHEQSPGMFEEFDVILSFDFNIKNTCTVWQIDHTPTETKEGTVYLLETVRHNDLVTMCKYLDQRYGSEMVWINGDASGGNRSAFTSGNISGYQIIKQAMNLSDSQLKIASFNASHENSRFMCNTALVRYDWVFFAKSDSESLYPDGNIELINDLLAAKVDSGFSLDPWKKKNPKIGHCLDTFRYLVQANFKGLHKTIN